MEIARSGLVEKKLDAAEPNMLPTPKNRNSERNPADGFLTNCAIRALRVELLTALIAGVGRFDSCGLSPIAQEVVHVR